MFKKIPHAQQMFGDKEKHILCKHYKVNHHNMTTALFIPKTNHAVVVIGKENRLKCQF